jgi:uncharacterized oligopeptide transporter (OPT) family protein
LPILKQLPIFGFAASTDWLWSFDVSPAYIGYGIVVGPAVNVSILLGTIIGWGILSPLAKYHGWAPGPVHDWDKGSRGWILWVGMGILLGDTFVGLGWITLKPLFQRLSRELKAGQYRQKRHPSPAPVEHERLLSEDVRGGDHEAEPSPSHLDDDNWPKASLISNLLTLRIGVVALLFYLVTTALCFRKMVTTLATLISVILIPLAGYMSMRSIGETDYGSALAIGMLLSPACHLGFLLTSL